MSQPTDLVIVGDSAFAEVAYEYFTHDSPYRVVGFSVERAYLKRPSLFGLPVVPFEEVEATFDPATHSAFVAVTYTQMNRVRARLYRAVKAKGYAPASYVSSRAFVWRNVVLGEHCFIFENNVVQPFVSLGNNVVLWSGNHLGHHSTVGDNCFLAVNSAVANNCAVGRDCWLSPGVVLTGDAPDGSLYGAAKAEPSKVGSLRFFRIGA